jgi:hypothetical protein
MTGRAFGGRGDGLLAAEMEDGLMRAPKRSPEELGRASTERRRRDLDL